MFFTRGDNIAKLNKVMLYIRKNEQTNDIKFVVLSGEFGPELIGTLSNEWKIPANFRLIGCPGQGLPHSLSEHGGVRVIV